VGKSVETDLILNGNSILGDAWEMLSVDPTGVDLFAGRHWINTSQKKKKFYDGTTIHVLADEAYVQQQINQIGQSQGAFDASSGALPTVANLIDSDTVIRRGDYWDISVAGDIAGLMGGEAHLAVGDVLKFVGTDPANASHWIGIQRNINETLLGNVKKERQTVNLVANTPLTVSAASFVDLFSIQCYNSVGEEIILEIKKGTNPNQRILTAKRSLTAVVVEMLGSAS